MIRPISKLIVHCSASDEKHQDSVEQIRLLHAGPRGHSIQWGTYQTTCRGWSDIGYHFIITQDGAIHVGRPIHKIGAHCKGHNAGSVGICLTGEKIFTEAQFKALRELINELTMEFGLTDIYPHNHFDPHKTCPNFDITEVLKMA